MPTKEESLKEVQGAFVPQTEAQRTALAGITKEFGTITTDTLSNPQSLVELGAPEVTLAPLIINDTQALATEDPNKWAKDYMDKLTQTYEAPPSGAEAYKETYGAPETPEQIKQKEAAVKVSTDKIAALNAQIQGIINSAQQANLTLESQAAGKDVTTSFLSKQQQEVNRQAAIQVLPLQTQVLTEQAALSGNQALLTQAQGKVDTYFKYLQQDAANQYNYQTSILDKFFEYADKKEQAELTKAKEEDSRAFQLATANRSDQNSWAAAAAGNGQGALATQIMALDATSPTFQQDLARLSGQIEEPTTTTGGGYVDTETGEEISPYDAGRKIIEANADKSDDELHLAIKEQVPELSVTDINKLIATRPVEEITPESAKQTIIDTLKTQKDIYSRGEAKTAIESQLRAALGLKDTDKLPKTYSNIVEDALVEIYGRTFWQWFWPGGR